jgi:hypothetical protein
VTPSRSDGTIPTTAMNAAHAKSDHDSQRGAPTVRAWSAKAEAPSANRPSATGRSQPSGV